MILRNCKNIINIRYSYLFFFDDKLVTLTKFAVTTFRKFGGLRLIAKKEKVAKRKKR